MELEKWKNFKEKVSILTGRFKTVNKTLTHILYAAIALVVVHDFILVNIPEWFPTASTIGTLVRNICFAYVTGYIFYVLNAHLSTHKAKVKTYRYTANRMAVLDDLSINLILSLKYSLGMPNSNYDVPPLDDVKQWCNQIHAHNPTKLHTFGFTNSFTNWFELFNFLDKQTNQAVRDLLLLKDTLDSETLRLLTNIDNCAVMFLNKSKGVPFNTRANTLQSWDFFIHEYRQMCHELMVHFKEEYEPYKKEYMYLEQKRR